MAKQQEQHANNLSETPSKARLSTPAGQPKDMLFGPKNYKVLGIGIILVVFGFFLMSGGAMPDANTWDESLIYSPVRITIAPIVVLAGLAVLGYSIFIKSDSAE